MYPYVYVYDGAYVHIFLEMGILYITIYMCINIGASIFMSVHEHSCCDETMISNAWSWSLNYLWNDMFAL